MIFPTHSRRDFSVFGVSFKSILLLDVHKLKNLLCRNVDISRKKLATSSMLHEAKVAYYAFDVAARFLIWLFMPFLWLR